METPREVVYKWDIYKLNKLDSTTKFFMPRQGQDLDSESEFLQLL